MRNFAPNINLYTPMKPICITPKAIRCNNAVKSFSTVTLKRIANMTPSELYAQIRAGKGVISEKDKTLLDLCKSLRREMEGFIPAAPMRNKHLQQMKSFISGWAREIDQYIKVLSKGTKPIYLCDEVTKILQQKGLKMTCTNIHLEWHLSLQGTKHMTPKEIADAIIDFDGTDWASIKHLKKDTHYNARLLEDTPKERARFVKIIEFIYDIPSAVQDKELATKINHDLTVLGDFNYWKTRSPKSYYYAEIYMDYVNQLQTAPTTKPEIDFDKDKPDIEKYEMKVSEKSKENSEEKKQVVAEQKRELTESEKRQIQLYGRVFSPTPPSQKSTNLILSADQQRSFLNKKVCPRCGKPIEQRTSVGNGNFLYCRHCQYSANGTFENPQIKYSFQNGVKADFSQY